MQEVDVLLDLLSICSVENSMSIDLTCIKVCDLTTDILGRLRKDVERIEESALLLVGVVPFRIKTKQSVQKKLNKYKDTDVTLQHVFKDLLACRVIVDEYPDVLENKHLERILHEDDYRALHYVYTKSRYHYPIEIQFWRKEDVLFNTLSHTYLYKANAKQEVCEEMRHLYDIGKIKNEEDFVRCLASISA